MTRFQFADRLGLESALANEPASSCPFRDATLRRTWLAAWTWQTRLLAEVIGFSSR